MRENIGLFKAKEAVNKDWVEGYFYKAPHSITGFPVYYICSTTFNEDTETWEVKVDIIDPETLCECIGKKDDNDNLIFEHDRLKDNKGQVGTVFYANCRYAVNWCGVDGEYFTDDCFCGKVIGNKFDTEQLEVESET